MVVSDDSLPFENGSFLGGRAVHFREGIDFDKKPRNYHRSLQESGGMLILQPVFMEAGHLDSD